MKLTILGCAGSFPGGGSHGSACSSYLVEADGFRLLLEFGTDNQAGEHATAARAGAVVLTHLVPEWVDIERVIAQARAACSGPLHVATPDKVCAV